MPNFIPPKFPTIDRGQMSQKFAKLDQILKEHTVGGQLQLKQLEALGAASTDPFIRDALSDLVAKNSTTKTVTVPVNVENYHYESAYAESIASTRVSDGYHIENRSKQVREVPDALKPESTNKVFSAVQSARQAMLQVLGTNGAASQAELVKFASAGNNDLWGSHIAEKAVALELQPYQTQLAAFMATRANLRSVDQQVKALAEKHGADPISKEAITWYLRSWALDQGLQLETDSADTSLNSAELQKHGLFRRPNLGPGHLSAEEVGKLVGNADLKAYSADTRKKIEAQVGGRYEEVLGHG